MRIFMPARGSSVVALAVAAASLLGAVPGAPALAQNSGGGAKQQQRPHPVATIVTDKGTIKVKLYPEEAPNTVANFVKLSRKGFYNGLTFHRVEPGFVIQGGDPEGNGRGGPGYMIKNEPNKILKHNRGAVAMANAGRDTAGSQFYIVIGQPAPHLDNGNYTIFGQVIQGQNVAEKIQVGDKMRKVTIAEGGGGAAAAKPKK